MATVSDEEWRAVPGWEGVYEVSDQGRVRSVDRRIAYANGVTQRSRGRLLRSRINPVSGRRQVSLWRNNKQATRNVYALVALAFIGPRPRDEEVRHLDGDLLDDRAENLAYGTHSENELDKVLHGTHKEARKTHCKRGHPFDEENTYFVAQNFRSRKCRICSREYSREYSERCRAARLAAS